MTFPVERLTKENLADVVEIGNAFTKEAGYPGGFDFVAFRNQWDKILELGIGEIFVIREAGRVVALFGAVFMPDAFSGWLTALEQFWYALPEYRGGRRAMRLFEAFEDEARKRGCRKILMVHLANLQPDRLEQLYLRRGYSLTEKTFSKVL